MLYSFLRILARWVLRVYFRRIYIEGTENIPSEHGTLLVSNHPNAFLEACLMACFQQHDLYFLVRGDVFKHSLAQAFLRGTHQIPIYRFRDGFANLKRNEASFQESYQVLKEGKKLLIFGEASTGFVRRLRPLQRGVARILQGAHSHYPDEQFYIVPTAVFFSHPEKLRSTVRIRFGQSINMEQWVPISGDNESLDEITSDIAKSLKNEMIHIPSDQWEEWMEFLLTLLNNEQNDLSLGHRIVRNNNHSIHRDISNLLNSTNKQIEELKNIVGEYRRLLDSESISDRDVQMAQSGEKVNNGEYLLGWPLNAIGRYGNIIPLFLATEVSNYLAPKREFIASMKVGFILVFYPVYLLILIAVGVALFSWWGLILFSLPFAGIYSLRYGDLQEIRMAKRKWYGLSQSFRKQTLYLRRKILTFNKECTDE